MDTKWVALLLVGIAAFSLLRIISQWRGLAKRKVTDMDEMFILQLRKAGVGSFEDHVVDFFFTMPSVKDCEEIRFLLKGEGYTTASQAEVEGGMFSLNLQRTMRIAVPEMQALTARFKPLAEERGGKYDGWAVARPKS